MKKLLSILATLGVSASTASSVIACGAPGTEKQLEAPEPRSFNLTVLESEISQLREDIYSLKASMNLPSEETKSSVGGMTTSFAALNISTNDDDRIKALEEQIKVLTDLIQQLIESNKVSQEQIKDLQKRLTEAEDKISKFYHEPFELNKLVTKSMRAVNTTYLVEKNGDKSGLIAEVKSFLVQELKSYDVNNDDFTINPENITFDNQPTAFFASVMVEAKKYEYPETIKVKGSTTIRVELAPLNLNIYPTNSFYGYTTGFQDISDQDRAKEAVSYLISDLGRGFSTDDFVVDGQSIVARDPDGITVLVKAANDNKKVTGQISVRLKFYKMFLNSFSDSVSADVAGNDWSKTSIKSAVIEAIKAKIPTVSTSDFVIDDGGIISTNDGARVIVKASPTSEKVVGQATIIVHKIQSKVKLNNLGMVIVPMANAFDQEGMRLAAVNAVIDQVPGTNISDYTIEWGNITLNKNGVVVNIKASPTTKRVTGQATVMVNYEKISVEGLQVPATTNIQAPSVDEIRQVAFNSVVESLELSKLVDQTNCNQFVVGDLDWTPDTVIVSVKAAPENALFTGVVHVAVSYGFATLINNQAPKDNQTYVLNGFDSLAVSLANGFSMSQLKITSNLEFDNYFHIAYPGTGQQEDSSSLLIQSTNLTPPEGVLITISNAFGNPVQKPITIRVINKTAPNKQNDGFVPLINGQVPADHQVYVIHKRSPLELTLANGFAMNQVRFDPGFSDYLAFNYPNNDREGSGIVYITGTRTTPPEGVELTISKAFDNSPLQPVTIRIIVR